MPVLRRLRRHLLRACPSAPDRRGQARILAALAGLVAAALLILATIVHRTSLSLDRLEQAGEERIVAQAVRGLGRALAGNVRDYAYWDDAVRHLVLALDPAWADANVGPYVTSTFGYEASFVLAGDGRTLYGQLEGAPLPAAAEAVAVLGPGLARLAAQVRAQAPPATVGGGGDGGGSSSEEGGEGEDGPATAFAVLRGAEGALFATAASPIVPQAGSTLRLPKGPAALLVFAKRLDAAFLEGLREDYRLPELRLREAGATATAGAETEAGGAAVPLAGPDGRAVASIVWQPSRPGSAQRAWLVPALAAALLVFAAFAWLVMRGIRTATAAIRASEARFRDIAEAASDWIWETDRELRLSYLSGRFAAVTGLDPAQAAGRHLHEILELPHDPEQRARQQAALAAARPFRDLLCTLRPSRGAGGDSPSSLLVLRVSGRPVLGPDGAFSGYRGTATDITAETAALEQARYLSEHDPLTGLPNRLLFQGRLSQTLLRCRRYEERAALLCLDLDRFKEVNDTLGHAAGDLLLVACADRLRACVRETDTVARLGGDEFAVLLTNLVEPGGVEAQQLCERLQAALAEPFRLEGVGAGSGSTGSGSHEAVIGVSIGVALLPADGEDAARLLQNADIALYRAKGDGRGRACFFEAGMDAALRRRKALEVSLRRAIEAQELEVYYQPQVATESGELIGVEALVRWRQPGRGVVGPAEFIPIAEETGLIVPIGAWVLRTACRDAARWPGLKLSVNVSPVQFRQRDLPLLVEEALVASGLPAERLELEITESVLMQNTAEALEVLGRLKALGAQIAMDDFGTGYSSLGYLQKFPFDKIKIDRSFISGAGAAGAQNGAIVRAVVSLGRSLGMQTCAEGVETEGQLRRLLEQGCEQAQGYLFGRPAPADAIDVLLWAQAARTGERTAAAATAAA